MRISILDKLEKELLDEYGQLASDDDENVFEYTEQDIYEQISKKIRDTKSPAVLLFS